MLSILRFGVCRSSDLSIHVRRIFPRTNALLQPSLGAMTALPMTGFHRAQISLHGKQYFRNTATFGILPCLLAISDSRGAVNIRQIRSVSGILTRFPCSANKNACPKGFRRLDGQSLACLASPGRAFATKAMLFNFSIRAPDLLHAKRPLLRG